MENSLPTEDSIDSFVEEYSEKITFELLFNIYYTEFEFVKVPIYTYLSPTNQDMAYLEDFNQGFT